MRYLELRTHVFWFRRRAPSALKPGTAFSLGEKQVVVGKHHYIRFSLHTSDRREAVKRARKYAHLFDVFVDRIQLGESVATGLKPASGAPSAEEIRHAAEFMFAHLLAADEAIDAKNVEAALNGKESEYAEADRHQLSFSTLPPLSSIGQAELIRRALPLFNFFLHQATGKQFERASAELLPLADAFRRYIAAPERRKASELVPTPDVPATLSVWSWGDAFAYYLKQRDALAARSQASYQLAW